MNVGNPRHKNTVSGLVLCCHDREMLAKSANIWLSGRHVADMLATFPAKVCVGGGSDDCGSGDSSCGVMLAASSGTTAMTAAVMVVVMVAVHHKPSYGLGWSGNINLINLIPKDWLLNLIVSSKHTFSLRSNLPPHLLCKNLSYMYINTYLCWIIASKE